MSMEVSNSVIYPVLGLRLSGSLFKSRQVLTMSMCRKPYKRAWEATVKHMTMQDWAKDIECHYGDEEGALTPIMKAYYRGTCCFHDQFESRLCSKFIFLST